MFSKRRVFQFVLILAALYVIVSICPSAWAAREHKPGTFVRPLDPGYPNNVISPDGNTIVKYENVSSNHNRVSFYDAETNKLIYQYNYNPYAGHDDSRAHAYKAYFSPDSTSVVLSIIYYLPKTAVEPFINLKLKRAVYNLEYYDMEKSSHYFSPDGQISYSDVTKDTYPWYYYKLVFADMEIGAELQKHDSGMSSGWTYSTPSVSSDGKNINFTLNGSSRNISTPTASLPDDPPDLPPLSIFSYEIDASEFPTIRYMVAVVNSKGEGVPGLSASNFSVAEDGASQSPLIVEAQGGGKPVSAAIVLDTSGSISDGELADINTAAQTFVSLRGSSDRGAVYKFSSSVHLIQGFTGNKSALNSAISGGRPSGTYTSLYDAIYDAVSLVSGEENERKAVVALTDGENNDSSHSKQQAIDFAVSKGAIVCTIGLGDFVNNQALYDIASQTGGQYYRAPSTNELQQIYTTISGSLKHHYRISYATNNPQKDGTSRTVTTKVTVASNSSQVSKSYTAPQGVKPTARIDSIAPNPAYRTKSVTFNGSGADSDGTISAYNWRSSIDGQLSIVRSFSTTSLSKGAHTIYLKVEDNDELWSDEVSSSLTINNNPPAANIDSIVPSAPLWGENVTFVGSGSDIDGSIAKYNWRSSIDGQLNTSSSFSTKSLSKGSHTIYFKVADNDGDWSGEVTKVLSIENNLPTAKIDSITPNPARYKQQVVFEGTGSDVDGEITEYSWRSDIDGQLSDKRAFTESSLTGGDHSIYFKVKDDDGDWSEETRQSLTVLADTSPDHQHGKGRHGNQNFVGDPVNVVNGNVHISVPGIYIPGRAGLALAVNFAYNSQKYYEGPLGFGWTHSYNMFIVEDGDSGTAKILEGDGHAVYFDKKSDSSYSPAKGEHSTLTKNSDGTYLWKKKHGLAYNFDAHGKLITKKDTNGNQINLLYNGEGLLSKVVDTVGREVLISYNSEKRIAVITDPRQRTVKFSYDSEGNLTKIEDVEGGVIQYEYKDAGDPHNITRSIDQNGHSAYHGYYAQDKCVVSYREGEEEKVELSYSQDENKTTMTDSKGSQTVRAYNDDGLVTKIIDASKNTVEYEWDSDYNKISITNQNGNITGFQYDENGNLLMAAIVMDPADLADDIITTYAYEPIYNRMVSKTDAEGNTTTYEYDSNGNLTAVVSPAPFNYRTEYTYDSNGQLLSIKDPRGNTTSHTYDRHGNLETVTDALGGVINYKYDEVGNLTEMADAEGNVTKYEYDKLNRLVKTIYPNDTYAEIEYDGVGNIIKTTNQLSNRR